MLQQATSRAIGRPGVRADLNENHSNNVSGQKAQPAQLLRQPHVTAQPPLAYDGARAADNRSFASKHPTQVIFSSERGGPGYCCFSLARFFSCVDRFVLSN